MRTQNKCTTRVLHHRRLSGLFKDGEPERAVEVYLFAFRGGEIHRDMDELAVKVSDDHSCSAAHSGMDCHLGKLRAEDRVVRGRRAGADDVARIDVFYSEKESFGGEIAFDLVFDENSDIA